MEKTYKFQIYCETDSKWETVILESDLTPPTKCPTDHSHIITANSASVIDTLEKGQVKSEPSLAHGGAKVARRGFKFTALAGQTTSYDYNITDTIYIKDAIAVTDKNVVGDQISAELVHPISGVLHKYIVDEPVRKDGITRVENDRATENTLAGLILRVTYKSIGPEDVIVGIGMGSYMD